MNIDLSINRLAFREADGLGYAQSLVAKKRQDLELRLLRSRIEEGEAADNASLESALRDMQDESELLFRTPGNDHRVDKTA